MTGQSNVALSK